MKRKHQQTLTQYVEQKMLQLLFTSFLFHEICFASFLPPLFLLLMWVSFVYQAEEGVGHALRRRAGASAGGTQL